MLFIIIGLSILLTVACFEIVELKRDLKVNKLHNTNNYIKHKCQHLYVTLDRDCNNCKAFTVALLKVINEGSK